MTELSQQRQEVKEKDDGITRKKGSERKGLQEVPENLMNRLAKSLYRVSGDFQSFTTCQPRQFGDELPSVPTLGFDIIPSTVNGVEKLLLTRS